MSNPRGDPLATLTAEVTELGDRLDDISDIVGKLVDGAATQAPPAAEGSGPVPWLPDLDVDDRNEAMRELTIWVLDQLVPHQPEFAASLWTCWSQHPDVVANLVALREAWRAAYCDPGASSTAALEWLDRWSPGTARRVDQSLRSCRRGNHREPRTSFGIQDT